MERSMPRCPKCKSVGSLVVTGQSEQSRLTVSCRVCGRTLEFVRTAGGSVKLVNGAKTFASVLPMLGFFGLKSWDDVQDWVQDLWP